jgi:hypothetical protein
MKKLGKFMKENREAMGLSLIPHDHERTQEQCIDGGKAGGPPNHRFIVSIAKGFIKDQPASVQGVEDDRHGQRPLKVRKQRKPKYFHHSIFLALPGNPKSLQSDFNVPPYRVFDFLFVRILVPKCEVPLVALTVLR